MKLYAKNESVVSVHVTLSECGSSGRTYITMTVIQDGKTIYSNGMSNSYSGNSLSYTTK